MKKLLLFLLALLVLTTITGCWDNRELDTLFIVTGVGLDVSDKPDELEVNAQIVRIAEGGSSSSGGQPGGGSGGGSSGGSSSMIILGASGKSVLAALSTLRHESTRLLYLHHNQMLVIGKELAQKGIRNHIDMFLRDEETRMETFLLVAEGNAKDVISTELDQEKLSGIAVSRMMRQFERISSNLNINMLRFVSRLLEKTTAPLLPIVEIIKEGESSKLNISKMAVFKGDRMVGELSWDEVTGYLWSMGETNEGILDLSLGGGTVAMNIIQAKETTIPVIESDGRIGVLLKVETVLDFEEINGFGDMKLEDLYNLIQEDATRKIENRIFTTYRKTQQLNADIYGYGELFHLKYPQLWNNIKQQWDTIYPTMQLALSVQVKIVGTGKVSFDLAMEENQE